MKILIYEDNQDDLNHLLKCIKKFFLEIKISYEIKTSNSSDYILYNHHNFDLIFLDIEVNGKSGIEIGCNIRRNNHDVKLIFITNYSKYLLDGYKAQANRYFVKPIQQDDFDLELRNVISDYLDEYAGFLDETISRNKIYYKSILYIEHINRKSKLHFVSGEVVETNYALKFWYEKLKENGFSQPYKSLLINLRHVSSFTKNEVILNNEELLPISRSFKHEFECRYIENLHNRV